MSNLFTLTVRNPQQAIALSAESLQIDAAANPDMFQPPHLRLFPSSAAILEGVTECVFTYSVFLTDLFSSRLFFVWRNLF